VVPKVNMVGEVLYVDAEPRDQGHNGIGQ